MTCVYPIKFFFSHPISFPSFFFRTPFYSFSLFHILRPRPVVSCLPPIFFNRVHSPSQLIPNLFPSVQLKFHTIFLYHFCCRNMEIAFDLSTIFTDNIQRLTRTDLLKYGPKRYWAVAQSIDCLGEMSSKVGSCFFPELFWRLLTMQNFLYGLDNWKCTAFVFFFAVPRMEESHHNVWQDRWPWRGADDLHYVGES